MSASVLAEREARTRRSEHLAPEGEATGFLRKTTRWMFVSVSSNEQRTNRRRNVTLPEPLPGFVLEAALSRPIWLSQKWVCFIGNGLRSPH